VSPARLETFADGVFAIAATLLIIEVGLPEELHEPLGSELLDIWPQYAAYVLSFLTIGIMWVNHHTIMRQVEAVDRTFLFLNLGLLLCIAFVPFPTSILAEFIQEDGARAAALLYGVTLTVTAIFFISVWLYASHRGRLLHAGVDPREVSGLTRSYLPGAPTYAAATLVAFVSPGVSALLFGLIAVFYMLSSAFFGRREIEA
jgi:TMEM175 potassium channel family protein